MEIPAIAIVDHCTPSRSRPSPKGSGEALSRRRRGRHAINDARAARASIETLPITQDALCADQRHGTDTTALVVFRLHETILILTTYRRFHENIVIDIHAPSPQVPVRALRRTRRAVPRVKLWRTTEEARMQFPARATRRSSRLSDLDDRRA